jgi:8-oxo-dGTP pyrophosphatase MutT (NUDIX family)
MEQRAFFSIGNARLMMLEDRIAAALDQHGDAPLLHAGDDYWAERSAAIGNGQAQRDAAVLVAFVDHPRPTLLLTRRTNQLRKHSGQVAFPGGKVDDSDDGPTAAALREAQEEVGLAAQHVRIISPTAPYRTVTNFVVTPVLAVIPAGLRYTANPDEVAHIFEAPIDVLFNPAQQILRTVDWEGRTRQYYEIHYDGERIWGATAAMIRNLGAQLGLADMPNMWNREAA